VLLYGGRSAEHVISCISARHVLNALDPERYQVFPVGITRDGRWVDTGDLVGRSGGDGSALPSPDAAPGGIVLATGSLPAAACTTPGAVVFPVLHGPMGEDGTVQGLLEVLGVPYVGAGVLASALCMDKSAAKEVLGFHGIPQAPWLSRPAADITPALLDEVAGELGYPLFVKPANLGSSIGISRATDPGELDEAAALAGRHDAVVVFEAAVRGREIEVAVLGNAVPAASVPGEIRSAGGFYDYDEKYVSERAELLVPAPLSGAGTAAARELALQVFRALRVEGMARVDLFYDEQGRFLVNEVNTIPGFTPISMYPRLWAASGLPTSRLLDRLVELALERHARRCAASS